MPKNYIYLVSTLVVCIWCLFGLWLTGTEIKRGPELCVTFIIATALSFAAWLFITAYNMKSR